MNMNHYKYGESDGEKLSRAEVLAKAAERAIDRDPLYLQLREQKERAEQEARNAKAHCVELQRRVTALEDEVRQLRDGPTTVIDGAV